MQPSNPFYIHTRKSPYFSKRINNAFAETKIKSPFQDVKNFLVEPDNIEDKNIYRYHLKINESSSSNTPMVSQKLIIEPEVKEPTVEEETVNENLKEQIHEEHKEVDKEEDKEAVKGVVEEEVKTQEPPPAQEVKTVVEEKQNPVKYRLEKILDPISRQYKFQLKKVTEAKPEPQAKLSENAPDPLTKSPTPPPTPPPTPLKAQTPPTPPKAPTQPTTPSKKRYRLEKVTDELGVSKYMLKEVSSTTVTPVTPVTPITPVNPETTEMNLYDDDSSSVQIRDLYKPSKQNIQHSIFTRKVTISEFLKSSVYSFMIGDNVSIQDDFTMKNVVENSVYLYNSHILDYMTIKVVTGFLNKKIRLVLNIFEMEFETHKSIKLKSFDLGEYENNNAKVFTKSIEKTTPKKGCFLISILDVFLDKNQFITRGSIFIETNLYVTNKRFSKEKTVLLQTIDEKPLFI